MTVLAPLADACIRCPGFPAVAPHDVAPEAEAPGSLKASYRCPGGHEWPCWWDADAATEACAASPTRVHPDETEIDANRRTA